MNADEFIKVEQEYGAHNYHPLPIVIAKAEGVWVWDVDGKKYIDMLSSYSAINQGHLHPRIVKAATKQLGRVSLTSRAFSNDKMGPLFWWELEDDIIVWVTAKITGPASYNAPTFTSVKVEDSIPELYIGSGDVHEYDFGPYTADFYDPGTYTVTASLIVQWDEGWDEPQKIATATKTLNVS